MANPEMLVLRLLHILCGVFWAGTLIYLATYVLPAVQAAGQEGGLIMQRLTSTRKFTVVMPLVALVNILAGLRMMWILSAGYQLSWFSSPYGMALGTGGLLAIIALAVGLLVTKPAVDRMGQIGKDIALAGGPPTADQQQEIMKLRGKSAAAIKVIAWMLGLAVACMSTARYL